MANKIKLDVPKMLRLYEEGKSAVELSKIFKCSSRTILRRLHENNVKIRPLGTQLINNKNAQKYDYDRKFFDNIDTPAKAYFLGFILGDGHLDPKRKTLQISLHKKDQEILENLIQEINGDLTQIKERGKKYCSLNLTSKELFQGLVSNGVPAGNKSLTALFPQNIDKELLSHFVRGLMDADGTYFIDKNRAPCLVLIQYGTKDICEKVADGFNYTKEYVSKHGKSSIFKFRIYISDSYEMRKLYDFLYRDSKNLCLSRKKEKFESIIKERIEWENLRRMRASKPEIVII